MISSLLAPKWPKLVPFCGLDHKKTWFLLVSGNFDVRGCWGQPMLLFWKNIDKTQMSPSPKCATTFFWTWKSFLVGHLGLQSMSYRVETPCSSLLKKCQNQKFIFLAISFCEIQLKCERQPITKQYFEILPDFQALTFQEKDTLHFGSSLFRITFLIIKCTGKLDR